MINLSYYKLYINNHIFIKKRNIKLNLRLFILKEKA